MAQAKTGSSASKKASSRSSNGSSASSSRAKKSPNSRAKSSNSKAKSAKSKAAKAKDEAAQQDGGVVGTVAGELRDAVKQVKGPALTGVATAAGLVGGAVLGARAMRKPKKVLGVPVPGTGGGLGRQVNKAAKRVGKAGKQAGKAGKQIGELTDEIRTARQKAEEIGKAVN